MFSQKEVLAESRAKNSENVKMLKTMKDNASAPYFKDTKVLTCSQVLMKNGVAVAIPFQSAPNKPKERNRSSDRSNSSSMYSSPPLAESQPYFSL